MDKFVTKLNHCVTGPPHPEMDQLVYDLRFNFIKNMDDDFNIAPALAALFQFTSQVNKIMARQGLAQKDKEKIMDHLKGVNSVLGVMDLDQAGMEKNVEELIKKREEARKAKDWKTADNIRRELKEKMGIELFDTKDGPIWR